MKQRKLIWTAAIRVDNFDEEMTKITKESGCEYFVVGVESFNQKKLDMMNKKITVQQIINTLDLLHKYNINYHGNILVGFMGETYEDIMDELKSMPSKYNVFPSFVRPFIGIKELCTHSLTAQEQDYLTNKFKEYIYSKGKYCYPELQAVA